MNLQAACDPSLTFPVALVEQLQPFGNRKQLESTAYVFKAIGDPVRLQILCTLGTQEMCVQDIAEELKMSHSNISRHLGVLQQGGVLLRRRDASRALYRVADPSALAMVVLVREIFGSRRR